MTAEKLEPQLFKKAKLKGKVSTEDLETKQVRWDA